MCVVGVRTPDNMSIMTTDACTTPQEVPLLPVRVLRRLLFFWPQAADGGE